MGEATLRIWPAVGHAYRFVWQNKLLFLSYSAIPMAISIAAAFAAGQYGGQHARAVEFVYGLVLFLCQCAFAVTWMRYCLLGDDHAKISMVFTRRTLAFTGYFIVIFLSFQMLLLIPGLILILVAPHMDGDYPAAALVAVRLGTLVLFYGWFALFALGLAARAVDRPFRDRRIARAVDGNVWRLAAICFVAYPLWAISDIPSAFLGEHIQLRYAVDAVAGFILMATLSTAVAEAFKSLTGWPDMGEPIPESSFDNNNPGSDGVLNDPESRYPHL